VSKLQSVVILDIANFELVSIYFCVFWSDWWMLWSGSCTRIRQRKKTVRKDFIIRMSWP